MMGTLRGLAICVLAIGCGDDGGGGGGGGDGSIDSPGGGIGQGISEMYPGDVGIGNDPRVIFFEDFEGYTDVNQLDAKWTARYHRVGLTQTAANVYAGSQAAEMTAPQQSQELSTALAYEPATTLDVLYLRYYSKYDPSFDITGSSHNGSDISAGYYVNGNATPGVPADGDNKYLIAYENWAGDRTATAPGLQNVYVYHPLQRDRYGDHFFPDGLVMPNTSRPFDFGSEFVARPNFTPELGRWYSFEVMLKPNTPPNMNDGRITCWIDGQIIADFPNLHLRNADTLKIDRFGISLHFGQNPIGETRKWYDNVVAATAYIGPMKP